MKSHAHNFYRYLCVCVCSSAYVVWCMFSNFWTQSHRKRRNHVPMAMRRFVAMRPPNRMQSFRNYRKSGVNMSIQDTAPAMASTSAGHRSCHKMATHSIMAIQNGRQSRCIFAPLRSTSEIRQRARPAAHIRHKRRAGHRHRHYRRPVTITFRPPTVAMAMNSNDPPYPSKRQRPNVMPMAATVVIPTGKSRSKSTTTMTNSLFYSAFIALPDQLLSNLSFRSFPFFNFTFNFISML